MKLKDIEVGDKVAIFKTANNTLSDYTRISDYTTEVFVLRKTENSVTVGWKSGSIVPRSPEILIDNSMYPGYIAWLNANLHRECLQIKEENGPCRQCAKINSPTDKMCWWCQVSNPTDLKRIGP